MQGILPIKTPNLALALGCAGNHVLSGPGNEKHGCQSWFIYSLRSFDIWKDFSTIVSDGRAPDKKERRNSAEFRLKISIVRPFR